MRHTTTRVIPAIALALMTATACDRGPALEVRTFPLSHLRPVEAHQLIEPYVYTDRAGAPGAVSQAGGAITVRETADNLDKITRVLGEFDVARPDLRLRFQLIEAGDFTADDDRVAAVEDELRKIFQFAGYRLGGEGVVSATDDASFHQVIRIGNEAYSLMGHLTLTQGAVRLEDVVFCCPGGGRLETSVVVRPGQTLVLGSSPGEGATSTLLLTVRAEEVSGPA